MNSVLVGISTTTVIHSLELDCNVFDSAGTGNCSRNADEFCVAC